MLLPAQMTQRGGICSDSQRITYTPAEGGRQSGDIGPCKPAPHGHAGNPRKEQLPQPGIKSGDRLLPETPCARRRKERLPPVSSSKRE